MGTAILDGLLASGMDAAMISVSTNTAASAAALENKHGVAAFSLEEDSSNNMAAVDQADVVIVATKPYLITEVLESLLPPLGWHWSNSCIY